MSEQLQPLDEFNQKLIDNVHPADWTNPTPTEPYNLVVIGAGTAGLVTAAGAAGLGAKVALIEKNMMGGDCLNVGCVPSKSLISAGRAWKGIQTASDLGLETNVTKRSFSIVMEKLRKVRAEISPHDSAARFKALGIDVYFGGGKFTSNKTVEVAGQTLQFKKGVIATGARAGSLPIPGLDEVQYLTNETIFNLTELPKRLAIIGGGPIGCEMAQAFAQLGSEVILFEVAPQVLIREDPDAAKIVEKALVSDGVQLMTSANIERIAKEESLIKITLGNGNGGMSYEVDELLVSVGRKPNVEGLGLERVGVEIDERKGVLVDDNLRTTNKRIFAAGDICSRFQFTHAADFQARIVIQNSLFFGRAKASSLTIPWCTYTTPEIAHVGLYAHEASQQNIPIDTYIQEFEGVDRAILEGKTDGFVKIHTLKGKDKIVGATIVGSHAGDLISEVSVAMKAGMGLKKISGVIHPYPTTADAIRRIGDQYNKTRLTPLAAKIINWLMAIQR